MAFFAAAAAKKADGRRWATARATRGVPAEWPGPAAVTGRHPADRQTCA